MTRRELAKLAAAGGATLLPTGPSAGRAAPADDSQGNAGSVYGGPLEGFADKVDADAFDPVLYTRKLYESAALRLTFRAQSRKQAEVWQKRWRAKLTELVGGFPAQRTALRQQTLEIREFRGYRREKFVFESRPGLLVLGYLLTPRDSPPPHAAMICIPGHGRGVDDIVGIDAQGHDRTDKPGYQHDFAIQVVEHGMAAVAIEPMAFGCRRDPVTRKKGAEATACQPSAGAALLLGQTLLGWRVYDVMCAIDWIETRKELDSNRVGCMGISGGGEVTTFAAALEPRIRAAMISGYLNTFRDSIMSLSHCIDNYVPGILDWAEMYDVAGLIAPRALFVESGMKDDIFPVEASKASFARVRKVYEVFGAGELCQQEVFNDIHSFWGVQGLPFLVKHLG
jgi:dienelactone hydrolase